MKLLTKDFLDRYEDSSIKSQLGQFVYLRTYSRFLNDKNRRETWKETVSRAVDYNCSLDPKCTKDEAEKLFDIVYNQRGFLSGRTLWIGGTDIVKEFGMANFNCAFMMIDDINKICELFHLLMVGAGVGVNITKEAISTLSSKLGNITNNKNREIELLPYEPVIKENRQEFVSYEYDKDSNEFIITVGDSKEGWVQALELLISINFDNKIIHESLNPKIIFNLNSIRPSGEKLVRFGGRASGPEPLGEMLIAINKIFNKWVSGEEIKPIHLLDIVTHIGKNVVSGGVRRTALSIAGDIDDEEYINAKRELYTQDDDGNWNINSNIINRQLSNNNILYKEKPSKETLIENINKVRYSGEPQALNEKTLKERNPNAKGVNPCGEILLDDRQLCNLVTTNVYEHVRDNKLDTELLFETARYLSRAAFRMTLIKYEIPSWNEANERDRLIGCSLTGWQDAVNKINISKIDKEMLLANLHDVIHATVDKYADSKNIQTAKLYTTVKPEGTLSLIPTVSSGVHYSHSEYFIRRVRIASTDPLCKLCEEYGYIVDNEVGQNDDNCTTKVISFPVKSSRGKTKYDVTAIDQLEEYKMFMENYVDHNCSITITVRDNEWEDVTDWVYENWDSIVGVTFLSLDDSFYELLPFEKIDEDEYNNMIAYYNTLKSINSNELSKFEIEDKTHETVIHETCAGGSCPIR